MGWGGERKADGPPTTMIHRRISSKAHGVLDRPGCGTDGRTDGTAPFVRGRAPDASRGKPRKIYNGNKNDKLRRVAK